MASSSTSRSKDYYDEFSHTYERQRHHGYHALLDSLELEVAQTYCGKRVLEAGCGTGLILQGLARLAEWAVGIDLSSGMLAKARDRGLRIAQCTVDHLPFAEDSFDTVVSFKVLAHVPEIEAALAELARVTRPGGHLVLEFYNRHSLRGLIKRLKRPTRIGSAFTDTDVYTRLDSLEEIRRYVPSELSLVDVRSIRVLTPFAQLHDVPLVGKVLGWAERTAAKAPGLRYLGGFLIVVLQKH